MKVFQKELRRIHSQWKRSLLFCLLMEMAGWALAAVAALCWFDLLLALGPSPRSYLGLSAMLVLGGWGLIRFLRILLLGRKAGAIYADRLLKSRRREVLSAFELSRSRDRETPLFAYLIKSSIDSAAERLRGIKNVRSVDEWRKARKLLLVCLAAALIPAMLSPRAALILLGRTFAPHADIPPYTRYVFDVSPEKLEVVYGADLVVSVEMKGPKVRQKVHFLTRQADQMMESSCYQASPTNYMQRLERVMQPVDFCFRIGRARSRWHRVTVLYQPNIESALVRVTPPRYSGLPKTEFELGAEPLEPLKGSEVELIVKSNRPLKKGALSLKPIDRITHTVNVDGRTLNKNELHFRWKVVSPANISVMIYDVLGTPAKKPLRIMQDVLPDNPPSVILSEPMMFSLATPKVSVPISGYVEDDLGIRHTAIFRAVRGYRSRSLEVNVGPDPRLCEAACRLELSKLGVVPGEVIEVFIEAADTNPDLTGISASDIARIQIISEQEYAEMIRARVTIKAFEERFLSVVRQYSELQRMLEKTKDDLANKNMTAAEKEKAMAEANRKIRETAEAIRKIAEDFAAFDLEQKLAAVSDEMAGVLEQNLEHSGWSSDDMQARQSALEECLNAMKGPSREGQDLKNLAEEVAEVSCVMECAAWYRSIVERQRLVVRRLERYSEGERNVLSPGAMAEREDGIRKNLEKLISELEQRAGVLSEDYAQLRESALEFVRVVRSLDIPSPMISCSTACKNEQAREAWSYSQQALEKMEEVMSKCGSGCFGKSCSGELTFKVPFDLSSTMSQMLSSLMQQYASGVGWGQSVGSAGVGAGGASEGSYMNGHSPLNIPVYGPSRSNPFSSPAAGMTGQGNGSTGAGGVGKVAAYSETVGSTVQLRAGGVGQAVEAVPVRYRDAVKTFYNEED